MPTLEWIGKDKVINHHLDVPFRVLERKYSYDAKGQHAENNGSENMMIKGDNLEVLKALLPRYEGKVKCIYIDPPYNTGNEGWVYNDNVNNPKIKKWLGEAVGKLSWVFSAQISPMQTSPAIAKSLYTSEATMNTLETRVADKLASLPNIAWWHRVMERSGFCQNGFISR